MNTTAHNHPPRCCCPYSQHLSDTPCPLCIEHGELAQLGNNARNTATEDCPHCHQPAGRACTEYCPTRCGHAPLVPLGPLGGRPDAWHTSPNDPAHLRTQCDPDTCGMHPLAMTPEQAERHVAQGMHTAPAKAAQPTIDSWPLEDIPDVDPWTAPLSGIEVRNPDRTTTAGGQTSQAPSRTGYGETTPYHHQALGLDQDHNCSERCYCPTAEVWGHMHPGGIRYTHLKGEACSYTLYDESGDTPPTTPAPITCPCSYTAGPITDHHPLCSNTPQ